MKREDEITRDSGDSGVTEEVPAENNRECCECLDEGKYEESRDDEEDDDDYDDNSSKLWRIVGKAAEVIIIIVLVTLLLSSFSERADLNRKIEDLEENIEQQDEILGQENVAVNFSAIEEDYSDDVKSELLLAELMTTSVYIDNKISATIVEMDNELRVIQFYQKKVDEEIQDGDLKQGIEDIIANHQEIYNGLVENKEGLEDFQEVTENMIDLIEEGEVPSQDAIDVFLGELNNI